METTQEPTKGNYKKKLGGITGKGFLPGVSGNPNGLRPVTKEQKIIKEVVRKTKRDVMAYLEKQGFGAAQRIVEISRKAKNENVKLTANKDVLDRLGVSKEQKGIGVAVQVNFRDNDLK